MANWVQESETKTAVPSGPMVSSGSLPPSGRISGILTKLGEVDFPCTATGMEIVMIRASANSKGDVFILSCSWLSREGSRSYSFRKVDISNQNSLSEGRC